MTAGNKTVAYRSRCMVLSLDAPARIPPDPTSLPPPGYAHEDFDDSNDA